MKEKIPARLRETAVIYAFAAIVLVLSGSLVLTSESQAFHYPWDQGHDGTDWEDPNNPGPCDGLFCDQDPNDCEGKGSPVYVATGYLNWLDADVALNGRPFLGVTRSYQSNDPRTGIFGNGWSFDHDKSLIITAGEDQNRAGSSYAITQVVLHAGNGKRFMWQYRGTPDRLSPRSRPEDSPSGVFVRPTFAANGTVRLSGRDGGYELYDRKGRITARADRNANRLRYSYFANGLLKQVVDDGGRSLNFRYDNNGLVKAVTDHSGRRWSYRYDNNGNLTSVRNPQGDTRRYAYQPYTSNADGFTYYQLTQVTDESGVVVTSVEYEGSQVTSYTEGENRWRYDYDTDDKTTTKTDSLGDREIYVYDDKGLIVEHRDANGNVSRVTRNASGLVTEAIDPLGNAWRKSYDRNGRRLSTTDALGNITRFRYRGSKPWPETVISPSGRRQTHRYDGKGNLQSLTDATGVKTTLKWSPRGDLLGGVSGTGSGGKMTYNRSGLPVTYTDEMGRVTRYRYDRRGNVISIRDPNDAITRFSYDLLDRVVTATDPNGSILRSRYDPAGRLLSITDERGNSTTHLYDEYGRHQQRTAPDGRQLSVSYSVDNLPSEITLEDGTIATLSYDSGDRLVREDIGGEVTSYRYSRRDELTSASNSQGSVRLSYDANGRKVSESYNGESFSWRYNKEDERVALEAFGGETTYSRDRRGYITAMSSPVGRFQFNYDPIGRRQQTSYPNGCSTRFSYDRAGGLLSMRHSGGFNANYRYERNAQGLISKWEGSTGGEWRYGYDDNNRLTSARQGSTTFGYRYDASGNRLNDGGVYDSANRLIENNDFTFVYDRRGRQTRKQNKVGGAYTDYVWNQRDQLIRLEQFASGSAVEPESTIEYEYGPFGRRWSRTIDGETQRYYYDDYDRIGTTDRRGRVVSQVTFGPLIDEPLGAQTPQGRRYFHANHQGSVMALTNGQGRPVAQARYSPYGITNTSGQDASNPFWFTGRERERDDLYNYRARYYDPTLGRFLSEDGLGFRAGDTNFYNYTFSDPVNYTDPAGTCVPITPDVIVDIGFIAYDVYRIFKDNVFGNCDNLNENLIALGADVAGACIPAVTGAGLATRAATRYGDEVLQAGSRYAPDIGDIARRSPCGCFSGDTTVLTEDGHQAIKDLIVGQRVLAWDEATGDTAFKAIEQSHRIEDKRVLYELQIKAKDGSVSSISVTDDHSFLTGDSEWVESGRLRAGMFFRNDSGEWLELVSIKPSSQRESTYSIEVADYHTFFVGDQSILVHNGKGPCNWDTPRNWADKDHDYIRDRMRQANRGYESGRHNEYPAAMRRELNRLADEADRAGHLPEYGERLREIARTYQRREGAAHRGGR